MTDLVVIHEPFESLAGKYKVKDLTYKDLEGKADEIIEEKVKNKFPQ
jgi:hypothetical protein